ncbi:hypothetical protein SAMN00017405_1059 [Desulfonispora thiosulfatigenes DSM 11270]|uniref:DUF5658 domain-containing protein n=1 Tax=Desulfonispora thiosulfatigenes DSM 11270 TaxID=656914 RepID=A0A1W1UR23_DESTI|nr:DUF5658 family protein [Desulfonispora thiosulfatigenes]SMB83565.1 hypothetical protein SAMN00017405_1059 [Desulfonispora thiosulfatigenes DSM 11270]
MQLTKRLNFKINFSANFILTLLFILMMLDYLITYYGMHSLGVLEESNALMVRFMKLPLSQGLILRTLYCVIFISLFKYVERSKTRLAFQKILLIPLSIQLIPISLHISWFYQYLNFYS